MARSKVTPGAGPSTAMMDAPLSVGASASVRQTTHKISAPLRSQPVAEETHFLRPLIVQLSPVSLALVRTPSPGDGEAAFALPSGSLKQNPASGAPLIFRNGARSRPHFSGVPPSEIGQRPNTVPSIVRVTLAFTLEKCTARIAMTTKPPPSPPTGAGMHLR